VCQAPPSTTISVPLTKAPAGLKSHTVAPAMSATVPILPTGIRLTLSSPSSISRDAPSVSAIGPGATTCRRRRGWRARRGTHVRAHAPGSQLDGEDAAEGVDAGLGGGSVGLERKAGVVKGGADHEVGAPPLGDVRERSFDLRGSADHVGHARTHRIVRAEEV
jgi:hypothetical protein